MGAKWEAEGMLLSHSRHALKRSRIVITLQLYNWEFMQQSFIHSIEKVQTQLWNMGKTSRSAVLKVINFVKNEIQ
jgi:hypothetical protein